MNKKNLAGGAMMALFIVLTISALALAGRGEHEDEHEHGIFERVSTLPAVSSKLYTTECGACHFAYQPGWLPARSWQKIMSTLDNHFDENAELDQESKDAITRYLVSEAADNKPNRKSYKILRSIGTEDAPLRISTLPYIVRKHHELPERVISGNPKVGSAANCVACHTGAATGNFDEHGVKIPGYGFWED